MTALRKIFKQKITTIGTKGRGSKDAKQQNKQGEEVVRKRGE